MVFTGPSLRPADLDALRALAAARGRELVLRPPVCRLDLLDLAETSPRHLIVMLDGEFGQRLSVSISEVREVLAAGLRLTGASSMGALRAVECRPLGMTGSGWVYRQYQSGVIESDGDVALLYDPETYLPVTIPLVNVRWLLARQERSGRIPAGTRHKALRVAHAVHFRDRRPALLLREWQRALPATVVDGLAGELRPDRLDGWDRKRLDALEAVRSALGADDEASIAAVR
ncbi:TfuA-like protein [Streptacidiphilus melanogenes]|uniref:TfuA-like protein n=1 Tax=Streptacidiphilus melanogenes TaxID=411235 RepID=UPI000693C26E|nr:TfuA-like protein [Streptacidiphilus melanogenes]